MKTIDVDTKDIFELGLARALLQGKIIVSYDEQGRAVYKKVKAN